MQKTCLSIVGNAMLGTALAILIYPAVSYLFEEAARIGVAGVAVIFIVSIGIQIARVL